MQTLKALIRNKEFVRNTVIVILILLGLRIFYTIPVPGINAAFFESMINGNGALGMVDMFAGNGLSSISVMMLNITPYITASIIIQLMGNVIPRLHELQRGRKDERKRYENITFIFAIILAAGESAALGIGYGRKGLFEHYTWYWLLLAVACWVFGTAVSSFLGKLIHEKFKVNGISLILLINILSGYPKGFLELRNRFVRDGNVAGIISFIVIVLVCVILLFAFAYFINNSGEKMKVTYSNTSVINGVSSDELEIKMCPGSVVPIIFASSLMATPVLIIGALTKSEDAFWTKLLSTNMWFIPADMLPTLGVLIYIGLIFAFSFYYADFSMNPKEIATDLKRAGGVISGVRPGKPTELYLKKKMNRVVLIGAIALIIIAVIPIVVSGLFGLSRLSFFGTSVIIIVGVLCELKETILAQSHHAKYIVKNNRKGIF